MKPLKVLITNIALSGRSGTETVARDLAIGLARLGHVPTLYSPLLFKDGQSGVAQEIIDAGIKITDDLDSLDETPDIIHGNHLHETMTACLRFPNTPAIWVCHSLDGPHDKAPQFPNIAKFLAVDESCLDRLLLEDKIPNEHTQLLLNCVDLTRFKQREPLPEHPKKALVLSHYAVNSKWLEIVKEACNKSGLQLDAVGAGLGNVTDAPEELLQEYDIVFAVDRTALEAASVGNAVILCGAPGLGPMVTSAQCDELHKQNYGRKFLDQPVTVENILARISEYDPFDAGNASERTRISADSEKYLSDVVGLYESILATATLLNATPEQQLQSLRCASRYCSSLASAVRTHIWGNNEHIQARIQRDHLEETAERRRARLVTLEYARHAAVVEREQAEAKVAELTQLLEEQKQINRQIDGQLAAAKLRANLVEEEVEELRRNGTAFKDTVLKIIGLRR